MKFYYKKTEITNKEEWKNAFCNAYNSKGKDVHWKDGRSGECLAEDFIGEKPNGESSMIEMVQRFLKIKENNISLNKAKIEHASKFDEHPRPRMQDLAIWGTSGSKNIFIGVEAKVDEPFGSKSINQQRTYVKNLKKNHTKTEAGNRLEELVDDYLQGDENKCGKLRYQLLYYLAGSFCEDADIIFMPVIVYESRGIMFNQYSQKKADINKNAYKNFMEKLGFVPRKDVINGQIKMAYYKQVSVKHKNHSKQTVKDVYSCYIVK